MDQWIAAALAWLHAHVVLSSAVLLAVGAQILAIAVAGAAAGLLRRLVRPATDRLIARIDPRLRSQRAVAAFRLLILPFFWWLFVLVLTLAGAAAGLDVRLMHVAASLLLAWIVIRASSALVSDPALSYAIAVVVWLIAAIDILGLRAAATATLDDFALTVGTLHLSLLSLIEAGLLLGLLLWGASVLSRLAQFRINRIASLTPSLQVLIGNVLRITLIVLAIVIALDTVGIDLTALALFSGAIGVGVGLGLQKVVANFVSGIILLLDRSIKPGDVIEVEQTFGRITAMAARYVSVRSRDGKEYLLPNEDLITHSVVNWTYSNSQVRLDLPFGVAYGSDLRQVRALGVAAAGTVARVVKTPPPVCHPTGFGNSAIDFLLRFWIDDPENGVTNVKGDVLIALYDSLTAAGIEVPFAQLEIRIKSPVPEASAAPPPV